MHMFRSLLLISLLFWCFLRAYPQDSSTGAVHGTVSDVSGSRVANATVVLANTGTGLRYAVTTDAEGRFSIELLSPGEYVGRAAAPGLSPQITPALRVEIGGLTEINFQLPVASAHETVTVSDAPPLVETQPSAISSVIDERAIGDLPLNGRRFTDLVLLTPGVTQDPRGLTSASNGDMAFGGIRGFQSSYLVDGADNNNGFFSQARGRYRAPYQFSNEVVQEFRVSSNTYGAELGRAGGAVVNVVTKSGSNHFHGTGFYFLRDNALNAQHPFMDFKPKSRQEQFGFTFGGPLRRNRAFFFAGWDQHRFRIPTVVRFVNGGSTVVPQKGDEPLHHGDYEDSDRALVSSAAQGLSTLSGEYPSKLLGNAAFAKVDVALTQRHQLSARLSSSRYYGTNNVFFDPASPLTTYGIGDNGEEDVATESASLSLTSSLSMHVVSHFRAQFSHDLQKSASNAQYPLTKIAGIIDGFGRSTILPRETREHRLHLAETFSVQGGRNSWKFGADALFSWIYNFFPSLTGGEFLFDTIKVSPFTFAPMTAGLELTPLRAYAHRVPHYYIQNFGSAVTNPDTNEYAAFLQDTIRVTNHLALNLGVRYDLQTFSHKGLVTNPLWPDSGKVPLDTNNVAPRIGLAYSFGDDRPLVLRAGYGMFYTRIPQIYTSTVQSDNGLTGTHLFLNATNFYDRQIFPQYPNPLVECASYALSCDAPAGLETSLQKDISAFAQNFRTPKVHQASVNLEREVGAKIAAGISYMYVHGQNLIRARDANLLPPEQVIYPVYDNSGTNPVDYYQVASFASWQFTRTMDCPFPPCINPLQRPITQLGSINVFESAASSVYHGLTVSVRRRMSNGLYFRLAYTYGHAMDDGQDALVAGRPADVQNSFDTKAERGPSVTDQRHRFVLSWITEPRPFDRSHVVLGKIFNGWKASGVITFGSGRPIDARVSGDPNQDGNTANDRLPGAGRNAFLGPDYATTDLRLSKKLYVHDRLKLELVAEGFNLLNRNNRRVKSSDDGFENAGAQFLQSDKHIGINYFPAFYQKTGNLLKATDAYAARELQLALRLTY